MYTYHGSTENQRRLEKDICRCATTPGSRVFTLSELVRDDKLIDPYDPTKILTSSPTVPIDAEEAYRPGIYIYAISTTREMRIALDCDRSHPNAVKHETLFHNEDVVVAGEIRFDEGMVVDVNDHSGSYGTRGAFEVDPSSLKSVYDVFLNQNVPVTPSLLESLADRLEAD